MSLLIGLLIVLQSLLSHGPQPVAEDASGFSCVWQGNHICGPDSGSEPGLYLVGVRIEPWDASKHYGIMPGHEYDHLVTG